MKRTFYPTTGRWWCLTLAISGCGLWGSPGEAADRPVAQIPSDTAAPALTMDEAIRLALDNNPMVHGSMGRIDAAAARAYQARLWPNPELELSAEDWPVTDGAGFADAKRTVGVAQVVPFPGKKDLDRRIGASGMRISEAELTLSRLELVREVKTVFFQVLALERLVEVAGDLVEVAESSAAAAAKRVAAGAAADPELLRAEIPLEQARIELAGFRRDLEAARQTLALLLGRPDLRIAALAGGLEPTANPALLDPPSTQWLETHPSVVAARISREQAELALRRARLEPYPDVKVSAAGGRVGENGQSIVQLGVSIPLPIFDRAKGREEEARAQINMAEADRLAVEQALWRAWSTANRRLRTAMDQVVTYRERILPKSNEALRLVRAGFQQGKLGLTDLLDTQRTAAQARLIYQQQLLELNVAQAELEALLGLGAKETHPSDVTHSQVNH